MDPSIYPRLNGGSVRKRPLRTRIWMNKETYFLLLPGLVWFFIFAYMPMGGLILAFKSYNASLGIWKSPFIGFENYEYVFTDPAFFNAIGNTLLISSLRVVIQFPIPIILALFINEVRVRYLKRPLQTVYTFPHFLSWIIVAGIMNNVFAMDGFINGIIQALGGQPVGFLSDGDTMFILLYVTDIWKSSGWSAIIFLAAIASIDSEQYDAAMVDGASRFKQMLHITIPSILPTISVMLVLRIGTLMYAGFDQIFNMTNPVVQQKIDILDTYIYRITFERTPDFGFSTAISLMRSVVNFILIVFANYSAQRLSGSGLFATSSS